MFKQWHHLETIQIIMISINLYYYFLQLWEIWSWKYVLNRYFLFNIKLLHVCGILNTHQAKTRNINLFKLCFSNNTKKKPNKKTEKTKMIYEKMSTYVFVLYSFLIFFRNLKSWPWSHGNWINNYLCNQCLTPLKSWVRTPFMAGCTRYNIMW
jgi:hypothetical protein